jgi:lipoyl synthase
MAAVNRFRCLNAPPLRLISRSVALGPSTTFRCLVIAYPDPSIPSSSTSTSSTEGPTRRRPTYFKDGLNSVPSFSEFIGLAEPPITPEDSLELRTAMVGPAGKQKQITRLPEWLKTPIPASNANYKQIKKDLRGLNLHTVCPLPQRLRLLGWLR